MLIDVVFTKDYANKKKNEGWSCDSMLAHRLVAIKKVAVKKEDWESSQKQVKPKSEAKKTK